MLNATMRRNLEEPQELHIYHCDRYASQRAAREQTVWLFLLPQFVPMSAVVAGTNAANPAQ